MLPRKSLYTGVSLLKQDLFDDGDAPNFICSDADGLKFNPDTYDNTNGNAKHSHIPVESSNVLWNYVKLGLTKGPGEDLNNLLPVNAATATNYSGDTTSFGAWNATVASSTEWHCNGPKSLKVTPNGSVAGECGYALTTETTPGKEYVGFIIFKGVLNEVYNGLLQQGNNPYTDYIGDNALNQITGTGEEQIVIVRGICPDTETSTQLILSKETINTNPFYIGMMGLFDIEELDQYDLEMIEQGRIRELYGMSTTAGDLTPTGYNLFSPNTADACKNGTTEGFQPQGGVTLSVSSDSYIGNTSLRVQTPNIGTNDGVATEYVKATPSKSYNFKLMIKGTGTIIIQCVERAKNYGAITFLTSDVITLTNTWAGYSFNLQTSDVCSFVQMKVLTATKQTADIYIDRFACNEGIQGTWAPGLNEPYNLNFALYGITSNGDITETPIVEKIISSVPSTETSEIVDIPLMNSACSVPLNKIKNLTISGNIHIGLPKQWKYYNTITLNRVWLEGFTKRKRIPITGPTGTPSEFMNNESLGPIKIIYDSDMQTNFDDIRFVDADGKTELHHTRVLKTDSSSATYFVKIPRVDVKVERNIYVYYGNPTAGPSEFLDNYMDHFASITRADDFEDGLYTGRTAPYLNWGTSVVTPSIYTSSPINGSKSLRIDGNHTDNKGQKMYFSSSANLYIVEFDFKVVTQGTLSYTPYINLWNLKYNSSASNFLIDTYFDGTNQKIRFAKTIGGTHTPIVTGTLMSGKIPLNTTYHFKARYWHDPSDDRVYAKVWVNDFLHIDSSAPNSDVPYNIVGVGSNQDTDIVIDNFQFKENKYKLPTIGSVGSEESTIQITPDTPTETETSVLFTLPSDWSDRSYSYLIGNEYAEDYRTNSVPISNSNSLIKGPNGLDAFIGLLVDINVTGMLGQKTKIDWIEYGYNII